MATVLDLSPIMQLTHERFYQLCMANRDVAMERSPKGELIIMTPIGGESGNQEASLAFGMSRPNSDLSLAPPP